MLQTTRIRSHVAIKHPFQLGVCIQKQQEKVKRSHRPVPVEHSAQEDGWVLSFEPHFSFFAGWLWASYSTSLCLDSSPALEQGKHTYCLGPIPWVAQGAMSVSTMLRYHLGYSSVPFNYLGKWKWRISQSPSSLLHHESLTWIKTKPLPAVI